MSVAEAYETAHWASGMRYQLSTTRSCGAAAHPPQHLVVNHPRARRRVPVRYHSGACSSQVLCSPDPEPGEGLTQNLPTAFGPVRNEATDAPRAHGVLVTRTRKESAPEWARGDPVAGNQAPRPQATTQSGGTSEISRAPEPRGRVEADAHLCPGWLRQDDAAGRVGGGGSSR